MELLAKPFEARKGVQIWRHDSGLARFDGGVKVKVRAIEIKNISILKIPDLLKNLCLTFFHPS